MKKLENIALFDLDGTLCDYNKGLFDELEKLRSPKEEVYHPEMRDNRPQYLINRCKLITSSEKWWEDLPKFQLGWDVLHVAKELEYQITILTQGPRKIPASWSGKKKWIDRHLGEDIDVTITRNKGRVYGKILVDDFPEYIKNWLEWRGRGVVIMPANEGNKSYRHPQVIRYDGTNLEEVRAAMEKVKLR